MGFTNKFRYTYRRGRQQMKRLYVIVVGRSADKMDSATAVLESHGFTASGVFSEQEAHQVIAQPDTLFAVVADGFLDAAAQNRLGSAASAKDAVPISSRIGRDDPRTLDLVSKLRVCRCVTCRSWSSIVGSRGEDDAAAAGRRPALGADRTPDPVPTSAARSGWAAPDR